MTDNPPVGISPAETALLDVITTACLWYLGEQRNDPQFADYAAGFPDDVRTGMHLWRERRVAELAAHLRAATTDTEAEAA